MEDMPSMTTKFFQKFEGHSEVVRNAIHLPGGQHIMTCSDDGSLGIWNLRTEEQIAFWQDGGSGVNTIALSVDGKKVISGSDDGVLRLWDIETGKVIAKWTGHTDGIASVAWDREGERVLSGSRDGTARVWDVETGGTVLQINTGLTFVTAIFSPDSTIIATGGNNWEDERIKIWVANTGELISILKGHTRSVSCLAWTADGNTLISGSYDASIRIWNTSTWQQIAVFTGHTYWVFGIAISSNGRVLASASLDSTSRLWNLENGQPIGLPFKHPKQVNCVSFSTDGKILATGCWDNHAYVWDISTIFEEAGLSEFLDDDEKSFLHADATRRPVQESKNDHTIPVGFFEAPHHPELTITHPTSPPLVTYNSPLIAHRTSPHLEVLPDVQSNPLEPTRHRFFKWFRNNTPSFLQRPRIPFLKRRQRYDNEAVELQERPPSIVNVPLAPGLSRYACEAGVRMKKKKEKAKKKAKAEDEAKEMDEAKAKKEKMKRVKLANHGEDITAINQPHTKSSITHHPAGPSQANRSSERQPTDSILHPAPADATPAVPIDKPSTLHPAAVLIRVGCLTRFSLCVGCASPYHSDGHH